MILPQELEVWKVIPAIRKEIVVNLEKKGMKHKDIAERLGITNPAVSQYLKEKRGCDVSFTKEIKEEIRKGALIIYIGGCSNIIIQKICKKVKESGFLCKIQPP